MFMLPGGRDRADRDPHCPHRIAGVRLRQAAEKRSRIVESHEGAESAEVRRHVEPVAGGGASCRFTTIPALTGLPPNDTAGDGTIQAIVARKVTIALQSTPERGEQVLRASRAAYEYDQPRLTLQMRRRPGGTRRVRRGQQRLDKLYLVKRLQHENRTRTASRRDRRDAGRKRRYITRRPRRCRAGRRYVAGGGPGSDDFVIANWEMVGQGFVPNGVPRPLGQEKWPKIHGSTRWRGIRSSTSQGGRRTHHLLADA